MTEIAAHEIVDVALTETGWVPQGDMSFEQWEAAGHELLRMGRAVGWWIGDWVLYGERKYGEMYAQALELTGLEYQTLANMVSVARRVPDSRRRENLSWSHHEAVAALEPPEQEEWLDRAQDDGLTVQRLRTRLKEGAPPSEPTSDPPGVQFRATVVFLIDAVDEDHAHLKLKEIAGLIERRGGHVSNKQAHRA